MMIFLILAGLVIAGWVAWRIVFGMMGSKKIFSSDKIFGDLFRMDLWKDVWKNQEMRRRIFVTIGVIVVYRILALIPFPGVNINALMNFFEMIKPVMTFVLPGSSSADVSVFSPVYQRFSLISFGLIPYIFGCLSVQVVALLIPPIKRKVFSAAGRNTLAKITAMVSVVICAVQAFFHVIALEGMLGEWRVITHSGFMFRSVAIASMVAAFCLTLWLAHMITEKGIGMGFGILLGIDVAIKIVFFLKALFSNMVTNYQPWVFSGVICLMIVAMMALVCLLTLWRKNLIVEIGGAKETIALRLSRLARVPVGFSVLLVAIPAALASFFPESVWQGIAAFFIRGRFFYYGAMIPLIAIITYGYTALVITPESDAGMIKKYGGRFDGRDKEGDIENHFYAELEQLTLWIAIMMIVLTLLPLFMSYLLGGNTAFSMLFGFGGFFIIFGVVLDTMENLKAKMERAAKRYDFLCLTATDEIEACVKKCFLESQGIGCVIEPFRFTWGLPVKTAGDEYRICVAESDIQRAVDVLKD